MEDAWRYRDGVWERMESPVEFYDEEGDPLVAPEGYSTRTRWFGDEDGFAVEVYSADLESEVRAEYSYLAMVYNVGDNVERVFLEDFPSLVRFLGEMAPILDLPSREWEPEIEGEDEDDVQ